MDALLGAEAEHHLLQFRIACRPDPVLNAGHEARGGQHLVAIVDTDQKLGWADIALNRAELHAFDLARYWPELACRVDLAFDPAAGILFHHGGEPLAPLVLRLVNGRGAELHHVGLVVSPSRTERAAEQRRAGASRNRCS